MEQIGKTVQISIEGEMTIQEIRQAIFEKLLEVEDDFAVRYSRGATLFINPTHGLHFIPV